MILNDLQKTLKFLWGNSWWFAKDSEIYLGQFCDSQHFSVIHKNWNLFELILDDSWWFVKNKIYLGWFSTILDDSQWFVKNSEIYLGWFFGVILDDLQKTEIYLGQFSVILDDYWRFPTKKLKFIWDDSWWFVKTSWDFFGVILGVNI